MVVGIPGGVAAAVALAAMPAALAAQRDCRFTDVIELAVPAVSTLRVDAGAGSLSIRGVEGTDEVRLVAKLCASDEGRLEDLGVTLRGDRVETSYPSNRGLSWGRNRYARINLAIEVPVDTDLRLEDGSGITHIHDTGGYVTLKDGSGNISIRGVGAVIVEDGSGNIEVRRANGDVRLKDASGNLNIEDVNGSLVIEDGSGSLTIHEVTGDVSISDGSGSIRVWQVGGSVHMDRIGSGSVTVRDVEGDLVVSEGRRERIRYSNIRGKLDLPPARRRG